MQTRWHSDVPTIAEYRSSFVHWDQRASVRVKPRRTVETDQEPELYFPPELIPAASHPLVTARGPEAFRRFLVSRLFQYLDFTVQLEATAVIPVTVDISLGRSGLDLSEQMRRDAFKITTDEAWHAQFSEDLMAQIERRTSVPIRLPCRPRFVTRLAQVRDRLDPDLRGCTPLAFAIVSETLISTILADLPRDSRLPQSVRDAVRDHAEDEGKHHAYFRSVLQAFWPALTADQRRRLGPSFPDLINIFLEPDFHGISAALCDIGLTDEEVAQVLTESYPDDVVRRHVATAAAATVQYLRDAGALGEPAARDAFLAAGLVPS